MFGALRFMAAGLWKPINHHKKFQLCSFGKQQFTVCGQADKQTSDVKPQEIQPAKSFDGQVASNFRRGISVN